jgi:hypothetical protein
VVAVSFDWDAYDCKHHPDSKANREGQRTRRKYHRGGASLETHRLA